MHPNDGLLHADCRLRDHLLSTQTRSPRPCTSTVPASPVPAPYQPAPLRVIYAATETITSHRPHSLLAAAATHPDTRAATHPDIRAVRRLEQRCDKRCAALICRVCAFDVGLITNCRSDSHSSCDWGCGGDGQTVLVHQGCRTAALHLSGWCGPGVQQSNQLKTLHFWLGSRDVVAGHHGMGSGTLRHDSG